MNQYNSFSDEDLVDIIVNDHQHELFAILYHRYYRKVTDKCHSLLKNRPQAEEFAEDIFSKVFEKVDTFKGNSSFSSWLYSITYNHCIDYLRLKKKMHYPQWNSKNELPEIIDDSDDEPQSIDYENLKAILDMIHPEEKALLLMKYQDNLSMKQISQSLRITEDAVKMRTKRARMRVLYLYSQQFNNN